MLYSRLALVRATLNTVVHSGWCDVNPGSSIAPTGILELLLSCSSLAFNDHINNIVKVWRLLCRGMWESVACVYQNNILLNAALWNNFQNPQASRGIPTEAGTPLNVCTFRNSSAARLLSASPSTNTHCVCVFRSTAQLHQTAWVTRLMESR